MIHYAIATKEDDEAIHQLNYEAFAEEIPQHPPNEERRLVDKFHDENTYLVGKENGKIVAMLALRDARPFSLEQKGITLPKDAGRPVEVRLLTVRPEHRNSRTFLGLMRYMMNHLEETGHDVAYISGTTREERLYGRFGFRVFAPAVGTAEAMFLPMRLTREDHLASPLAATLRPVTFLAGPVSVHPNVLKAAALEPVPHRSQEMVNLMRQLADKLRALVNLPHLATLLGSGTLANDAVAAQLRNRGGRGLIVDSGQFGRRLADHALRAGLSFDRFEQAEGRSLDIERLTDGFERIRPDWIWLVHCETSTGVLHDIDTVSRLCNKYSCMLALDAISSVGTAPYDFSRCDYVSFVSGKALGGLTGLAFVAMSEAPLATPDMPRYLDLSLYQDYVAFSHSSNLVRACLAAIDVLDLESAGRKMDILIDVLAGHGITPLAEPDSQARGILTLVFEDATEIARQLKANGFSVQFESEYLAERNWLQVSTMGHTTERQCRELAHRIGMLANRSASIES
ncbi:GNAT family N-acetyltransferase [Exiguobacterium flavidum]|uniref:GNAT family N-acetyltransferase n=1 Tax=Exiguobacterium flavidum TaxID=2184695 RepID=UPI000DF84EFE|nr:GNAT family N-acetyltransferase [Exiguobacterium flavidum]